MRTDSHLVVRLTLLALGASALVACSSTPKKPATIAINTPPVEAPVVDSKPTPTPPVASRDTAPLTRPTTPATTPSVGIGPGSIQDFVVNVGDRIYFDYDQYTIRPDAKAILDAQAAWLVRFPAVNIRIEGNSDERGTQEYNFALGERRANSVRDYLVSKGVAATRLNVVSYGKERPIDAGSNEEAWSHNRNGHTAIVSGAR